MNVTTHGVLKSPEGADRIYSNTNHFIALFFYPFYPIVKHRAWILDVMLIALVSNVTLLVWLSNFTQCWLPCARLNPVAQIPWAPSTVQILKVTLIEWLLKLMLLALHQVFTPYDSNNNMHAVHLWSDFDHFLNARWFKCKYE